MGKVFKGLVKFSVAAATLGGICYVFKDQIRESKVYKDHDMDEKIKKVTSTIKEKIPKVFDNEEDYVDEDEIFFDDLDLAAEDMEREYVSINSDSEEKTEDAPKSIMEKVGDAIEAAKAEMTEETAEEA